MDEKSQPGLAKLAGALAAAVAGAAAQKVLVAGWKAARGHKPPTAEDPDAGIGLGEVLVAAALTGAAVAVVKVLATRSATRAVAARAR